MKGERWLSCISDVSVRGTTGSRPQVGKGVNLAVFKHNLCKVGISEGYLGTLCRTLLHDFKIVLSWHKKSLTIQLSTIGYFKVVQSSLLSSKKYTEE